ncbi:CAMK family protein kinase [Tritrichomonas foetus]|uniref:CAMK family protein kinase n=1 Tax=Tritrichomonas foetus TaxID=1144522 RepID=A0A1J4JYG4_9EUKA|nr:CAMK family protein kinase [Tritrichomonas foetus]|eukprot:OHT03512.1 CAMK family protein kinase [Tritrichomonas foetus]
MNNLNCIMYCRKPITFSHSNFFITDKIIDDSTFINQKQTKKVNQYALVKKIGSGSFSKVFMAVDTNTKITYAAKVIKINSRSEGSFVLEREIKNMKSLKSPQIIELSEVLYSKRSETAFLILEWANCGSLQKCIDKNIKLSEKVIAGILKQIIIGTKYLHSQGIVHHDIKPANILLFQNGAKLADFGIGHSFQSTDNVIGTPAFQAPEVFGYHEDFMNPNNNLNNSNLVNNYDSLPAEEDVWSLGVTLFYTVFGYLPYVGDNIYEIVRLIHQTKLEIPKTASEELEDVLRRMLEVDPNKRITMDELLVHPFFVHAPNQFVVPIEPKFASASIPEDNSIVKIQAERCEDNYKFGPAKRSLSWPGVLCC